MFDKALGVLTAVVVVAAPIASAAKARHAFVVTKVEANKGWQKVRLTLGGRGEIRFKAAGKWIFNPSQPAVGGNGAGNLSTSGRTSYTFSGSDGREGQLIGRIGQGAPFVAGTQGVHEVRPNEIGRLYLMINDDYKQNAGAGLADNGGHLRVRIDYER
ncbi:MAG: hypothetical protein WA792_14450 [Pseudolabrys sp.]